MSGFLITNHYPAINETDVPRNPVIKVYFNRELNISSITYRSISIHDSLYATVPGDVEYDYSDGGTSSGVANILTFTPSILLDANLKYRVFIHKTPDCVLSTNDDPLLDTYKYSFYTGSGTIDITEPTALQQLEIDLQHAIDLEDWDQASEIQGLIDNYASGVIPSGAVEPPEVITSLSVVNTYPSNRDGNISLGDLNFVKIAFNDVPAVSGVAIGDYISLTHKSVIS